MIESNATIAVFSLMSSAFLFKPAGFGNLSMKESGVCFLIPDFFSYSFFDLANKFFYVIVQPIDVINLFGTRIDTARHSNDQDQERSGFTYQG
jgi:hypothetical protein